MANTEAQVIQDLTAVALAPRNVNADAKPFSVIPEGYAIHDLEPTLDRPMRKRGTVTMNDAASFIDYFKLHHMASRIYGQVDFVFQEEIQGSAGAKGHIKVPERFYIGIPVFEGGAPYRIECKLRYRLKDGALSMWFDLVRDHKVQEAAFMDIWKEIAEGTSTTIWRGVPA